MSRCETQVDCYLQNCYSSVSDLDTTRHKGVTTCRSLHTRGGGMTYDKLNPSSQVYLSHAAAVSTYTLYKETELSKLTWVPYLLCNGWLHTYPVWKIFTEKIL